MTIIEETCILTVTLTTRCCFVEILIHTRSSWNSSSWNSSSGRSRGRSVWVFFELTKFAKYLVKLALAFFFFNVTFRYYECALLVHKIAGANSPWNSTVDTVPLSFEVWLNLLQTVKCTHLLLRSRLWSSPCWRLVRAAGACSIVTCNLLLLLLLWGLLCRTCKTRIRVIIHARWVAWHLAASVMGWVLVTNIWIIIHNSSYAVPVYELVVPLSLELCSSPPGVFFMLSPYYTKKNKFEIKTYVNLSRVRLPAILILRISNEWLSVDTFHLA